MYFCHTNLKTKKMNRYRWVCTLGIVAISILLLGSCKKRVTPPVEQPRASAECPLSTIPSDFADLDASTPTYPLPKAFFNDFMKYAQQYEGTHITIPAQLPQDWVLLCREPLPASQELWLIQSVDKDWTYLLVTAGQHVRDALPVALDLASPGDVIESEVWTWHRDEDGAFLVTKHYVKRPDANDTTQHQRKLEALDRYVVSESGQFKCTPQSLTEGTPYQAVILFNLASERPDSWYDMMSSIAPYCEENNIYFATVASASEDLHHVVIEDYQLNYITTIDLAPLLDNVEQGLVLIQNGAEPRVESYSDNERYLQMKIRNYFNSTSNKNL